MGIFPYFCFDGGSILVRKRRFTMLLPPYQAVEVMPVDQMSILRRHFNLYYKILAESKCIPNAQWDTFFGTSRYLSGLANPYTNMVIGMPKIQSCWDEEIQKNIEFFKQNQLPFVWYIDEKANSFFKERLVAHGFTEQGVFQGVIGPLDKLFNEPIVAENCTLELVTDENTMNACNELICQCFHIEVQVKNIIKRLCGAKKSFFIGLQK